MGNWTAVVDGWECVDCGYVHPGEIDIHAHTAHVCQLTIDSELGRVIPSRDTDPETSHAAAKGIRVKAGTQRARLLEAFSVPRTGFQGWTDEQAMAMAEDVSPSSEYSKRCSELRDAGFIEPTGETRISPSTGKHRIVSKITDKGRAWIEGNR